MFAKTKMGAAIGLAAMLCASAAGAAPTAKQTELAHRYIQATHMERMMSATMKTMAPAMLANIPKGTEAEEARRKVVMEVLPDVMNGMMAKMMVQMEPIVAETFSEKELTDLVAFYESPTGQAVVEKTPQMAARMMPMMATLMPEMTKELKAKVCAKTDCTAAPNAASKSD